MYDHRCAVRGVLVKRMNSGWNRSAALSTTYFLGLKITALGDGGLLRHRMDCATDDCRHPT